MLIVFIVWFIIFYIIVGSIYSENFINASIKVDPLVKYLNAYYYEWPDDQYLINLFLTFDIKKRRPISNNWIAVRDIKELDKRTYDAYQEIYRFILHRLNVSQYMELKGSQKIQIIEDIVNRYQIVNDVIIFDVDMILYREGKFRAKHINMIVAYRSYNYIEVMDCEMSGSISEDVFFLHPVSAIDLFESNYSRIL